MKKLKLLRSSGTNHFSDCKLKSNYTRGSKILTTLPALYVN